MYKTRTIRILDKDRRSLAIAAIENAPDGVEVVIREPVTTRSQSQNALMWSGPLRDLEEQAWVHGRQFSAEVWHEYLKALYLPEETDPDIENLVTNVRVYKKWDISPKGDRVLVGSTTQLSKKGMSDYLDKVYAFGAGLGVMFSATEKWMVHGRN